MTSPTASDYEAFEGLSLESRRLLRQEQLIVEVTEAIARALKEASLSQSQLAERLGKTKGFVSQILGGGRNLTLRTLSDVADALESCVRVNIVRELERIEGSLEWPEQRKQDNKEEPVLEVQSANDNYEWEAAA